MERKFFVYELNLTGCTAAEMIDTLMSPRFNKTTVQREFGPVSLSKGGISSPREHLYAGYLFLNQMKLLPLKTNNRTDVSSALFDDKDDGLRHTSTFIIDTELNILVFESVRFGPSEKCFCEILEKARKNIKCELPFVLNKNGREKFNNMTSFKSIEIELTKAETQAKKENLKNKSLSSLINSVAALDYEVLRVFISADKGNSYLDKAALSNFARAALRMGDDVNKIKIRGRRGHNEKLEAVDLVVDRKVLKINIGLERNESQAYINRKQILLLDKYLEVREEVRELVTVKPRK